ncbi:hypothetical protein EXE41_02565 [Halorubrum sp. SD690R]|uniref:hypothetical protein n=1 Tax=Halorubrum sp. SD690R TaxID=2518117 RepID=UPI0010F8A767|nr:hypothetical protein [Halorubrum sp. SD690R]TKX47819.1 hypothetical protein EXE41_02565 [Halorubrum sp. SD690R]
MTRRRAVLGTILGGTALSGCVGIGNSHEQNQDGLTTTNEYTTTSGGNQVLILTYDVNLAEGEWAGTDYNVDFDCWIYIDAQPVSGSIQVALGHERDLYGYRGDGELNPYFSRKGADEVGNPDRVFAETYGEWNMIVDNTDYFDGFSPAGDVSGELEIIIEAINA